MIKENYNFGFQLKDLKKENNDFKGYKVIASKNNKEKKSSK